MDFRFVSSISREEMRRRYSKKIGEIFEQIQSKSALGVEYTDWIPWIFKDHTEIINKADSIRKDWIENGIDTVLIIGTGGSYLGSRACLDFVTSPWAASKLSFIFLPYFSERYSLETINYLKTRKFAIVLISKSGKTLESAVTFRLFREILFNREKERHNRFIIVITSFSGGSLYSLSQKHNYHLFQIEENIGGRYSTLTPVGIVPVVLSGIPGMELIRGARACYQDYFHLDWDRSAPAQYASYRHYFFESKKLSMECLISYEPQLLSTLHKAKQLFSESEGKNGKGLMPVILDFTPDLHSVGQLLQEGHQSFFETVFWVKKTEELKITQSVFENEDNLDWLRGISLREINYSALIGTAEAHHSLNGVDILIINISDWTPYTFGYLYFFLSLSAMFSAYLLDQNPFTQPGVEEYKTRMISLLKKQKT